MREWQVETAGAEETALLGRLLGELLEQGLTLFLTGDLGAGKTCFTQGLARGLEVASDQPVTSPSYTLLNCYRGRLEFCHFDLYRLHDPDELVEIDFDEYRRGQGVTVVEWADRFPDLGGADLEVDLAHVDERRRALTFRAAGASRSKLLERLARLWRERTSLND